MGQIKNVALYLVIFATSALAVFGHGLAVHVAQIDNVLNYYSEHYSPGDSQWTYYEIISAYPEYFKYGSILPDMQYVNSQKPVLEDVYAEANNNTPLPLAFTYQINMSDVPDPEGENGSYSFGINTHDYRYAFQFAQYLLDQANADPTSSGNQDYPYNGPLFDPPGPDYVDVGTESCLTRGQKIALAAGYYAHLCQDVVARNITVNSIKKMDNQNLPRMDHSSSDNAPIIPSIRRHIY